jgi:hypothetical protein
MVQVTVEQAVSDFGRLLEKVGQGEEFVIVQGDAPLTIFRRFDGGLLIASEFIPWQTCITSNLNPL